jgi:hypothetical protein
MKRTTLIVMLLLACSVVAGCTAAKPVIAAPDTEQGRRCAIGCDQSYSTCHSHCPVKLFTGYPCTADCADAYTSCMQLCQ